MTDRELLELAAKAAGFQFNPTMSMKGSLWGCWPTDRIQDVYEWNPLTDDGDALRLAVAIPACIVIDNDMQWCGVHLRGSRGKYDFVEKFKGDKSAATRRAIVRAAAEIGKSMKG